MFTSKTSDSTDKYAHSLAALFIHKFTEEIRFLKVENNDLMNIIQELRDLVERTQSDKQKLELEMLQRRCE